MGGKVGRGSERLRMQIKTVPQTYGGVLFRSTLEADWAATFDSRGVEWQYEPEAIELPSGTLYRPDFWLSGLECWAEVKGPTVPGLEKAIELATIADVIVCRPSIRGLADWQLIGGGCIAFDRRTERITEALGITAMDKHDDYLAWFFREIGDGRGNRCTAFVRASRN